MTMTQNHHELAPKLCAEFLDSSITRVSNLEISENLTHDTLDWGQWLVEQLGIDRGSINIHRHHQQSVQVEYTVTMSFDAKPKGAFDEDDARERLTKVVKRLVASRGVMHPRERCECIFTVCEILLRLSNLEFGDLRFIIRNSNLVELLHIASMRLGVHGIEEQVRGYLFPISRR